MREDLLWAWLRDGSVKQLTPALHMVRIENSVDRGTPDVEGCLQGRQFWCELKGAGRPARASTAISLRALTPVQVGWAWRRHMAGGATWFLIRVGAGPETRRYLVHGGLGAELLEGRTEEWLTIHSSVTPSASAIEVVRRMAFRR